VISIPRLCIRSPIERLEDELCERPLVLDRLIHQERERLLCGSHRRRTDVLLVLPHTFIGRGKTSDRLSSPASLRTSKSIRRIATFRLISQFAYHIFGICNSTSCIRVISHQTIGDSTTKVIGMDFDAVHSRTRTWQLSPIACVQASRVESRFSDGSAYRLARV